jgi:hypothetical protein
VDPYTLSAIVAVVSSVGTLLANRIVSGAKPVVDPNNTRPAVDAVRDLIRAELVAYFGGGKPMPTPVPVAAPTPAPAPSLDHPAIGMLLQLLLQALQGQVAAKPAVPVDAIAGKVGV